MPIGFSVQNFPQINIKSPATIFTALAVVYVLFLLYGSLVPLNFYLMPLDQAWREFTQLSIKHLSIGSRSDLLANILLYIPLSYLICGVVWYQTHRSDIWILIGVFAFCQSLSLLIEFLQVFSPLRTTDLRDILANGFGSVIGLILWRHSANHINRLFAGWQHVLGIDKNKLLPVYLIIFTLYALIPLDLTISPVEIYNKFTRGRVLFIPFREDVWIGRKIQMLTMEMSLWAVIGFLWALSSSQTAKQIWIKGSLFAVFLECAQLFVFSRVTDVTDMLTGSLGVAVGVSAVVLFRRWSPALCNVRTEYSRLPEILIATFLFLTSLFIVCWKYWFPFNFEFAAEFLARRWQQVNTFPFWLHFNTGEFSSLGDIIKTILLYSPIGVASCFFIYTLRGVLPPLILHNASILGMLFFAMLVEIGQILKPDAYPDITDVIFGWISMVAAYFFCYQLFVKKTSG